MANLQRVVLVIGVLAALAATFIWPPKVLYAVGGRKLPASICASEGGAGAIGDCRNATVVDGVVLFSRVVVIVLATGALAYATRPRSSGT